MPANAARLRKKLVSWYGKHARDLPWRRTSDAYAIWVSEVMLQQTRVDTVIPYYEHFLRKFPTVRALAKADEDAVLAAWSGLGYYRRARLLHAGVREVAATYGGKVPRDAESRRALPGIGRYTAGAIGSLAFGAEEPIVDGNVARVLTRIDGIRTPLGDARTEKALWARAEELVRGKDPGTLNQALMELGALVCTPRNPNCAACPVKANCTALEEGLTEKLPVPRAKRPPEKQAWSVVVARTTKGDLVVTRGQAKLFGGLWSPPYAEGSGEADARGALKAAGLKSTGALTPRGSFRHVLSHRDLAITVWTATVKGARRSMHLAIVAGDGLRELGVSSLTRKALVIEARGSDRQRTRLPARSRRPA